MRQASYGFTAIELLVSIVVGVLLLGSGYQLYMVVSKDSGDAQRQSRANAAASDLMRQGENRVAKTCTTQASLTGLAQPTYADLPNMSTNVSITCPYPANLNISRVTVTLEYVNERNGPVQRVTRALLVNRNE